MVAGAPPRAPTAADRRALRAVWSLGAATTAAVAVAGHRPPVAIPAAARRLRRLQAAGLLAGRELFTGPAGHRRLWWCTGRVGRLEAALAGGWRPSPAAVWHTAAVSEALVAALAPGHAGPVEVTGWHGEAELRRWSATWDGLPYPDLVVDWQGPGAGGSWMLEIDRGTETLGTWERKLTRYLAHPPPTERWLLVALASGTVRARHLAEAALRLDVPAVACPVKDWCAGSDPMVFAAVSGRRERLSAATLGVT